MLSVKSSQKIKTSLFIVFLMISMTWSAGVNEIVAKYEHRGDLSELAISESYAGCDSVTRTVGTPIYIDPINGSASWSGTINCPKNSLSEAISAAIPGDEIILQSGNYHDNVTIDNLDDLVIRAADGASVVFDGTKSITADLAAVWGNADSDGIQEADLPVAGWQLFYNYDEQVPARWPNAQFSDETVFNRSNWAEGTLTSNNNAYTQGWLTDAGPETGVHTGLNETINATGLDPVGAIAILNLGSFRSNSREITGWNGANGTFSYDPTGVSWKNKHHAYFLEGKRELIDVDGEWWFDTDNLRLHYKTPGGQDANNLDLRIKVQPFAISIENSDRVTIQGIDFFGTTVNFNNCDRCSFTNSTLEYPSTSKRGLGISGESEDDRWMTRFYRCTNTFVDRISITNTDGGALEFHGSGGQSHNNTVNNSYFYAIDWSAADQKGLMTTIYEGGRDMYFTNNTVHLTGASSVLSIGDAPKVFYNEVWNVGHLQTDGAVVQVMQGEAPGAEIAYNWIHDVIKYGARFDAPINQVGEGMNGTMHHNVIWNAAGGLMVKGDYHNIHNNTVFDSSGKNDIIFLTDGGINNKNSALHRNAVDSMADHRSDDVYGYPLPDGTNWNNWNGYTEGYRQSIASGYGSSNCIISNAQSLYCWGDNTYGSLGNGLHGTGVFSSLPVEITSFGTGLYPVKVATGGYHSCAILNDGTVSCWGYNSHGQLGDGTQISRYTPTPTLSLGIGVKAVDIVAGGHHSCAVLDDGNVKCWGSNVYGQLGDGTTTNSFSPITISGFTGTSQAISLTAGWTFTCALIEDGSVKCWGRNQNGQLGLGTSGAPSTTPTQSTSFGSGLYAVDVDAGWAQTCAVINDGRVMCWGQGSNGRLGTGNSFQQTTPTFTASLGTDRYAKQVVQGGGHGCAVIDDGTVKCWGSGISTGTGASTDVFTPTTTDSLGVGRTAHALIAGTGHVCAILDDATMTCWGTGGNGRLGNGATDNQLSPVPVITTGVPKYWQVSDFLVDPDNRDFRPKWGSPLHVLDAGAYAADDASAWVPGTTWSYSPLSSPTVGCTDEGALNYDSNAEFEDGSCYYITITPSVTSSQLTANTPMTPITISAITSYVTNSSSQPFQFSAGYDVHQDMDIAVDRNGNSHICFRTPDGGGNLFYMTDVTGVWAWEGVHVTSSFNVGLECNIEVDSNDVIHIVYQKVTTADISYATRAISFDGSISGDSTWAKSHVNTANNLGAFISMDIDKHDTLYVAYFRGPPSGQDLLWSKKVSGGSWTHGTIDTSGATGRYNSIVVDDSDLSIHVSYKYGTGNDLKYANKAVGSPWSIQNIDPSNNTNGETSVALDSNGYVHIVSSAANSDSLIYSTNAGGAGFVTTPIDEGTDGEQGAMLRLDENDNVHIVYHARATDKLNYSSNAQGSWITQTLDGESTARGKGVSMELDTNGDMHLVYLDQDNNQLRFGKFRSLANTETYDIHPDLPTGLSFGTNNGTIWGTPAEGFAANDYTIYANTTTQSADTTVQLMSMWQVEPSVEGLELMKDETITPITFNWTAWSSGVVNSTSSVHTPGNSGSYNSIVIDSNDKAHIVFYREDNANLMYSTNKSGSWVTSSIETSNNVGKYCSLAIDSNNGLHVSYQYNSGNSLKYAYKSASSSSWSKTTIDNTGGKFTSIAIDSNDKPHIAYRDSGGDLGYAEKTGSSWTFNAVQPAGDIAFTSIAIDSDDHIHIAYYDDSNNDMFHLTDTSSSWVRTFLEDIGDNTGGMALDIAIDPTTDEPGISYFDKDNTALKYTYFAGSSWTSSTIENTADYGRFNSIVYDSLGNVHISHERNSADDLYYTSDKTGSWVTTLVDATGSTGTYTGIAADGNDDIHIAYRYNTAGDLYHATVQGHNSGAVSRADVSSAACTFSPSLPTGLNVESGTCTISGAPSSIQFNTTHTITATSSTGLSYTGQFYLNVMDQTPVISYTGSPFTYTKDVAISPISPANAGGDIPLHVIDSIGDVGNHSSMVMDSNGKMHISYLDDTNGKLKYATDKSGTWVDTIIGDMSASSTSIAVDSNNNIHIAYALNLYLQYATDKSGTWVSSQIDSQFGAGFDASIAIDSNDKVHIAHYNMHNTGYLRYSTDESGSWVHSNIFNYLTDDCSILPSIGIDSNDNIHISCIFVGVGFNELHYLTDKSGSWVSTNVDNLGTIRVSSLSIDSNDKVHISYYDSTNDDLKYATDKSGSWQTSIIDSTGDSGSYSSLAIDSSDNIHISYFQNPNGDLRYATDESGSWATSTLDSEGHVGPHNSLLVDTSGNIHVAYYDETNEDLNYLIATSNGRLGWAISPALPDGLVFDENTGEITGTPTVLSPSTTYTVSATNSGGTDTATISLAILESAPIIAYSTTVFDLIVDEAMDLITPSNSGGAATSWSISPAEPTGLSFDTSTGELSGTPTAESVSQVYTVTATNSGGTDTATLTIQVQAFATLTSSVEGISDIPNSAITPITFTHTINGDTSSPAWTTGVSPGSSQVIDGSFTRGNDIAQGPNGAMAIVGYESLSGDMKLAYYYDGSWTTSIIQNSVTSLDYPSVGIDSNGVVHIVYLDMVNDVLRYATNSSGTWQVIDLHATSGSDKNVGKGWISGTDLAIDSIDNLHIVYSTKNIANTIHTINYTTNQGGGWSSTMISDVTKEAFDPAIALDSNDKAHVSYFRESGNNLIYATNEGGTWNREIVDEPDNQGKYSSITVDYNDVVHISYIQDDSNNDVKLATGNSGSWSVSEVQGNPGSQGAFYTSIAADSNGDLHIVYGRFNFAHNYILEYVTNSSGSWNKLTLSPDGGTFSSISIDSNDDIHIVHSDVAVNQELEHATVSGSGKGVKQHTTWQISPALPDGLHMNWRNGTISGTPTAIYSNTTHTISATISGNTVSTTLYLEFQLDAPEISYAQNDLTLTKGTAMGAVSATNNGGAADSWAISPSFANGLNFDGFTGEITGTPNTLQTRIEYTITATNSGGTSTAYVNITINDVVPAINYNPTVFDLTNGTPMSTVTPSNTGGPVITWWISPTLSDGLTFDNSNGEISGSPTELRQTTMYTITATNSGGSSVDYVNITVTDTGPSISYTPNDFNLTINVVMSPTATPDNIGGAIPVRIIDNPTSQQQNSIAIDSQGYRHVAYKKANDLYYATDKTGVWVDILVDTTLTVGHYPDIAIDSNDKIHISYYGSSISGLKYATDESGSWVVTIIDNSADVGQFGSIAIDSNDKIHISYFDDDNNDLKYAYCVSSCSSANSWTVSTLYATGDTGRQSELMIDSSDILHIAFYDNGIEALMYATDQSGAWVITVVDNTGGPSGTTGGQPSIAVDSTGTIHIVHRDVDASGIRHSTCSMSCSSSGSWSNSPLESAGDVGQQSSMVIDSQDHLHVTYYDNSNVALRYATNTSGSWVFTNLATDGAVGLWSSIALDTDDNIHILYSDFTTPALKIITISDDGMYGYSISPDLPNGLSIDAVTGEISGTPTVLSPATVYTITAINSGGATTTTITLAVNDEPPSISYPYASYIFTKDLTISTIHASATGGEATSWEASDLPAGLSIDANDGYIWGTPTAVTPATTYTIWANNSGGSASTIITMTVNDIAPGTLVYNPVDMDLTLNQAMTPNTVSHSGGAVTSWEIEPDIPTGLNFGSSNGTIWGTPTVLQTSPITYTIWANNSGGSSSITVTITIVDDAASIYYSLDEIVATLGVPISPHSSPTNTGGAVATWEISPDPGTHFHFNTVNGVISGTPGALLTRAQYTIYANNSGGSSVAHVNVTVNDVAPSITYNETALTLVVNSAMTPLTVINSGGTIVSCSESPNLPNGLLLSNTCEITGTPTVTTTLIPYTITATNSGGTDSTSVYILVQSAAGTLTISPVNTEGSVNTTISDITMTYTHTASSYGWTSGVTNGSSFLTSNFQYGDGPHWFGIDSGEQDEMAVVYAHNDTGATTHSLALMYRWNGVWTEYLLDSDTDTGQHPSVAIDRQGALHIAYIDTHNDKLRYATNVTGTWAFITLGDAVHNSGSRGTAIVVHPITDSVHIVTTNYANSNHHLQYHTNEDGTWFNETITDTTKDEGYFPSMVVDGDGDLYVAHHCDSGCQDLRLSSRINGVWQNETVAGVANLYGMSTVDYDIGNTAEMTIDSQGTLHIVSQSASKRIYLHSGTPGNWFEDRNATTECCGHWPAVAVDSNDAVHIAYHIGSNKNLKYLTNASGSWSPPKVMDGYAGWGSVMEVDSNDDIFIASNAPNDNAIKLTTVKGSGQGLTAIPMFDISPPLPDGLTMNWRTGTISGTPTEVHANTTHTVTVTALGFTTTGTLTLYITGAPGSIAYADITGTHHAAIAPQYPTFTNSSTSGDITSWESDPMLPTGLNIGSVNGTIWGTPSVIIAGGVYVIWANNSVGSASTTVNITINAQAPGSFNYNPVDIDLTINQAMTPNIVSPGGGAVTSWEIEPDVPNGLNFGSSNGTIWGTPTVLQTSPVTYTIWANNSGGSSSTTVTITINDEVPTLSYPNSPYTIVRGYDMTDITPVVGGGTVLTWEISPSLPSGLSFTSGVISGKPFANQSTVTYTVYANNSGGSGSATFDLTINEPTPNIDYNPDNYTLTNNTAIRIDPVLQAGSPAGLGTLMTGSSIRVSGCMQLIGNLIFFIARDEMPAPTYTNTGYELWVFNHTQNPSASNPYLVKDINPGSSSSLSNVYSTTNCLSLMFVHNNTLFFKADDGINGNELWKSDGTNAGTALLKDIRGGSSSGNPRNFFTIGDTLYFSASTSSAYNGIWKTDGTTAGTTQISNTCGYNFNCGFTEMVEYNGSIYGSGYDWSAGNELFVMNGSTWQMVVDLSPGSNFNVPLHTNPRHLTVFDDWLYFDSNNLAKIYRTNGTAAGTTEFISGTTNGYTPMQVFNDELYFVRQGMGASGYELWKTDGTNIMLVKDVNPSNFGANSGFCTGTQYHTCSTEFQVFGDYMLFVANGGSTGPELWITDGTTAGTQLLKDINPGATGSIPQDFFVMGDVVYFRANDGTNGYELWRTDGTATGTVLVNDILLGSSGATPWDFIQVGDDLYFSAASSSGIGGFFQVNNAANGIIGAPTTWSISPPTLPSGLTFNNGVISGTPTVLQLTPIMYTITASNANGSSSTTINLTIIDAAPGTFAYNPVDMDLTLNQAMTPNTVSPGGGAVTSWEISPDLPAGLNFESSNGTIWGTPTILQINPVMYTIWANNSGGSTSATVTITVIDEAPSISYAYDDIVATLNVSISPHSGPTNTGGAVTTWEISPSPGPAFHFNTYNGVISGTPGVLLPTTQYTVYANNSGGSSIAYVNVTVNPDAPNISYSPNELNLTRATTSSDLPLSPTNTGGNMQTASFCSSINSPPLFVVSDHEGTRHVLCNKDLYSTYLNGTQTVSTNLVSGNPFALEIDEDGHLHIGHWTYTYPYAYIHHATNKHGSWQSSDVYNFSGGFDGDDFKMAVGSDDSLHFTYTTAGSGGNSNDLRYLTNQSGSWSSASVASGTGGYRAEDPQIALNSEDVPHIIYNTYTWGINVGKYDNNTFTNLFSHSSLYKFGDITIDSNDHVHVTYSKYQGLFYSTNASGSWQSSTIASLGGTVLDTRIALDSNDHPHVMSASITGQYNNYKHVSHYNHNGTSWNGGFITPAMSSISQLRPDIFIDDNDVISTVYHDQSNGNLFTGTGSTIYGYSISPALPNGLRFSQSTGTISGIANVQMNRTMYTITANNSGGSSTTYINITVDARAPSFTYNPENLTLTNNTVSNDLPLVPTFHYSTDAPTDWVLLGTLPAGLNFGTNNGTIWGTATELWATTNYTVYGNNTGGSFNVSINITVNDEVPTLSYTPSTLVLTLGQQSSDLPLNATLTGSGDITSWEINATLPSGLNFGTSNGTIWGTPAVLQTTATTYTIWANNTGGSTSATVTITIIDEAPGPFQYNPENNTWTNNTEVHLAPQFINGTTGNGSTWQVADIYTAGTAGSSPRSFTLVGGVLYFKAGTADGRELWAHDPSNRSTWQVVDINSGSGDGMASGELMLVGDTLYFGGNDGSTGNELWAHDTSNHSTWQVADINSGAGDSDALGGSLLRILVGDTLYFVADDGSTGNELWAHDTSNHSTWQVADINSGSGDSNAGGNMHYLVGDTLYFGANDGSTGHELWAHDTSNHSTWQVIDLWTGGSNGNIHSSHPGWTLDVLVGDTLYFGAQDGSTTAGGFTQTLWAHDTSNHSTWRINDGSGNGFGVSMFMCVLVGDAFYFSNGGNQLSVHDTSNHSTWQVSDAPSGIVGRYKELLVDDTLYFVATDGSTGYEWWAHDTSNRSTWQVADIRSGSGDSNPSDKMLLLVGDTIYFDAYDGGSIGRQLWAYDTSNRSTWRVTDNNSGSYPGQAYVSSGIFVDDTIYFSFRDGSGFGSTGYELWAHRPSSIDYNTNTGGAVTSWAINASLPSGVSFGTNNGTVYGTPTELWPQTSYMVWANNSGGSSVAYLNITVVDYLPTDFTYNPDDLQLTNNTASADLPLAPQLTGPGEILSWELNNTNLPSGILFGSDNGTFYGTPTELWPTTPYKVWANNTGGSVEAYLNITVVDQLPTSINYPVINLNLTNNTASPDLPMNPQITGPGTIISWEISGELPEGLVFDSNTGEISGIPTELWPTTDYTVWANNTGGSVEIEFNITVVDQLPSTFTYSPSDLLLTNNTASSDLPLQPQLTGPGAITSWSINETLPLGLNFGNNNGTIWGIPTELQLTPKPFNITASNTGGSIYAIINITILEVAPTLVYDPDDYNFTRNVTISDIVPTYTPLDLIDTWEITPDVPLGLTFDNGTISGTPTVNMTRTEFTVWANNSGGSTSAIFNITIVEPTGSFAYLPDDVNMTRGQSISTIYPNYNGGAIENWSIHPDLPTGLIFDNGTISGTPTVNSTKVNYTVYANNSGGSVSAFISITINEPVASIIYVPDERNETRTISMTPWFPQVAGGAVETWEIYPELPLGLSIVDGVISGTATVNSTRTNYTVWANNSGGSASTNIHLTVVEPVVELSYNNYELILVRNVTMAPLMPQLSGGVAETWEIYPDLPDGIELTNGMLSGTPTVNSTRTMYNIWANNTGGSTNVSLNITILEPSANIVYDSTNLVLTRGEAMDPAIPELEGGAIENWSIYPDLPDGLVFNNGSISGTPTVNMTIANYLIYGNNSGGSSVVGLSITILEPAPTITYQTDYLVLTRGEAMPSALQAIFGGGAVASFIVTPELPDGLNFTNGTIFGTPTVNSTLVQYNITALNNGGSDYFLLNITILEPVAILNAETTYFQLVRSEDYMNLTLNNTGGMAATWEIEPFLPDGLIFGNGTITGTPTVNASLASYTIWANNSGGSDSIIISIKILEPVANISYRQTDFTVVNGQGSLYISPDILGGNPETWEFEPELPSGVTFSNGLISGVPTENLTTTTYTVWANNSGGTSFATINLTINQPFFVVRYPTTILVLNVSEDMPVTAPLYYFDEDDKPVWNIEPTLPDGLIFDNGTIFGIPTTPQPLTIYNITVRGELVPFTLSVMIEILAVEDEMVIEDQRNASQVNAPPPETVFPDPEEQNIAYWLCPLLLIILLWLTAMLYNVKNRNEEVELETEPEVEAKEE